MPAGKRAARPSRQRSPCSGWRWVTSTMTAGSLRGKCCASQIWQRRRWPPWMLTVGPPQTPQKRLPAVPEGERPGVGEAAGLARRQPGADRAHLGEAAARRGGAPEVGGEQADAVLLAEEDRLLGQRLAELGRRSGSRRAADRRCRPAPRAPTSGAPGVRGSARQVGEPFGVQPAMGGAIEAVAAVAVRRRVGQPGHGASQVGRAAQSTPTRRRHQPGGWQRGALRVGAFSASSEGGRRESSDRIVRLRTASDRWSGRAAEGFSLPLPGLPEADREHLRRRRLFFRAKRSGPKAARTQVQTRVRRRPRGHLPFLPRLRLDRPLGA